MTDVCFEYHKYQLNQKQKDKRANISKKKVIRTSVKKRFTGGM